MGKLIQKTPTHNGIWQSQWVVWYHPITANIDTAQGEKQVWTLSKIRTLCCHYQQRGNLLECFKKLESLVNANSPTNARDHDFPEIAPKEMFSIQTRLGAPPIHKAPRKPDLGFLITSSLSPPRSSYEPTSLVNVCVPRDGVLSPLQPDRLEEP